MGAVAFLNAGGLSHAGVALEFVGCLQQLIFLKFLSDFKGFAPTLKPPTSSKGHLERNLFGGAGGGGGGWQLTLAGSLKTSWFGVAWLWAS